jgi:hypothetical protein
MFDGPEYEPYIALCRELRLEREFEECDHYAAFWNPWEGSAPPPKVTTWTNAKQDWSAARTWFDRGSTSARDVVWLPRLDQWLTMLEEAGWMEVRFSPSAYLMDESPVFWRIEGSGIDRRYNVHTTVEYTDLRTREEAAARLWMAVTGRNKGEST